MLNEETRKKAVFSADDFGISKLANVNILKAVRMGKIDRVEVMISENLNAEEVRELKNSQVKIDIHLHLVDYNSNYWRGDRRLSEGTIKRVIMFLLRYLLGKTVPEKVELQWAIQIEKFEEIFGKAPDGIGSHEYIHFFPPYLRAVIRLSKKYDISFIRFGKTDFEYNNFISKALNLLRKKSLKNIKQTKLNTTDYMTSFDWGYNLDFLNNLPAGSLTEIVFHPEREDELKYLEKL
ncbi:MAG: ChbG/HpnK family deacetylase [Candidatus Moraniibacteriota bacterium]